MSFQLDRVDASYDLGMVARSGAMHVARNKRTYVAKSGERRVYESVLVRRTYPGLYVPQPLPLHPVRDGTDLETTATDVLALSKMN